MRKQIQKQMMQLLGTVREGLLHVPRSTASYKITLLRDCLGGVQAVETVLGQQLTPQGYARYEKNLSLLCQVLSLDIPGKEELDASCESVGELCQMLQNEPEIRPEIVFMPYKISMWDSMETVWQAAKDDPGCDCYVVPIPYYERNSDGSARKLCYEGERFPKEVQAVHYSQYSLEDNQPDIIYIHNPYDGYNLITSVAPPYYSEQLKKYTDCLVYIPYFLAGPYSSKDSAAPFCTSSGIQNADLVIAQSDVHKQLFVDCGIKADKVLALGNPKQDKAIRENTASIPERWREICRDKTVFFYNSGLSDLLRDTESFESICSNIRLLAQPENAAVIWRPHPLLLATLCSMRTDQTDAMKTLLDEIKEMPNVILDETDDIYPAMRCCDAMVSDYSSVMFQFILCGKPVLSLAGSSQYYVKRKNHKGIYFSLNYYGAYFYHSWKKHPGVKVETFRDMVLKGEDPNKEERIALLKGSLANCDGHCGEKIHQKVMELFSKEKDKLCVLKIAE